VLEVADIVPHQGVQGQEPVEEEVVFLEEVLGEVGIHTAQSQDPEANRELDRHILGQGPLRGHVLGLLTALEGVEAGEGGALASAALARV